MTYWVITKHNNSIYMAADLRASAKIGPYRETVTYSDVSKKLFTANYTTIHNNKITLGLCTSGYAANHNNPSIVEILEAFIKRVERKKLDFNNGRSFINALIDYIIKSQPQLFRESIGSQTQPFGKYIVDNTCFGLGICINNEISISAWDKKRTLSNVDYLESDFQAQCLKYMFYRYSPQMSRLFHENSLPKLIDNEIYFHGGLEFVKQIISIAAKTGIIQDGPRLISETCDFAAITANNLQLFSHKHSDIRLADQGIFFTHGSNRAAMPNREFKIFGFCY